MSGKREFSFYQRHFPAIYSATHSPRDARTSTLDSREPNRDYAPPYR